ncbi:2'-5' RNA ligase [Candidatus Amesbacteria bacterium RIFOXYB1_FULL_47_13]|nr:MAG: 2'-5' RNA ligase [Candidatus Amesbacteria bacterium RIFOXYB1_FULL_47_13]
MTRRLFIAITPPQVILDSLGEFQLQLQSLNLPVDWEPREKLHITLNFLGRVADDDFTPVIRNLAAFARSRTGLSLTPMFLETLYQRHDNSLIYIGFSGDLKQLRQMQKSLSLSLSQLSFPQPRRFLPHLTIGRLKRTDPTTTKKYMDLIRPREFIPLPAFTVDSLALYQSFLSRAGSHYQRLRTFTLGDSPSTL